MPEINLAGNLSWARFVAAAVILSLIILMAFAMFSTRRTLYPNQNSEALYDPEMQLNLLRKNVGSSIHRGLGEIL